MMKGKYCIGGNGGTSLGTRKQTLITHCVVRLLVVIISCFILTTVCAEQSIVTNEQELFSAINSGATEVVISGKITLSKTLRLINDTTLIGVSGSNDGIDALLRSSNTAYSFSLIDAGLNNVSVCHLMLSGGVGFEGWAITASDYAKIYVDHCLFANNRAEYGGAISTEHGDIHILNESVFTNNTASFVGGAIYSSGARLYLNDSSVSGNQAAIGGGIGMYGDVYITGTSSLIGNTAKEYGGGICTMGHTYFEANGNVTTSENVVISHNSSKSGAGIYADGDVKLIGGVLENNIADTFAGGIYCRYGSIEITDCNLAENRAEYGSIACFPAQGIWTYSDVAAPIEPKVYLRGNTTIENEPINAFQNDAGGFISVVDERIN